MKDAYGLDLPDSTNDFRCTYTTLLEDFFSLDAKPIVNGGFEKLAFIR